MIVEHTAGKDETFGIDPLRFFDDAEIRAAISIRCADQVSVIVYCVVESEVRPTYGILRAEGAEAAGMVSAITPITETSREPYRMVDQSMWSLLNNQGEDLDATIKIASRFAAKAGDVFNITRFAIKPEHLEDAPLEVQGDGRYDESESDLFARMRARFAEAELVSMPTDLVEIDYDSVEARRGVTCSPFVPDELLMHKGDLFPDEVMYYAKSDGEAGLNGNHKLWACRVYKHELGHWLVIIRHGRAGANLQDKADATHYRDWLGADRVRDVKIRAKTTKGYIWLASRGRS